MPGIKNATLTSISRVTGATGSGQLIRTAQTMDVRVLSMDPSSAQRWALGATISDASKTVYIDLEDLDNRPLKDLDLISVAEDDQPTMTLQLVKVVTIVKDGGMSHCQCFGKAVAG